MNARELDCYWYKKMINISEGRCVWNETLYNVDMCWSITQNTNNIIILMFYMKINVILKNKLATKSMVKETNIYITN